MGDHFAHAWFVRIYIYIYIYMCVCVCVCVRIWKYSADQTMCITKLIFVVSATQKSLPVREALLPANEERSVNCIFIHVEECLMV
jgi:hypothetical protein